MDSTNNIPLRILFFKEKDWSDSLSMNNNGQTETIRRNKHNQFPFVIHSFIITDCITDLYSKCVYLWFPETWGLIPFSCFLCWSLGSELRFVSCLFSILFEKLHLDSRGSNWFEICTVGDTKGFRLKWHLQLVQRFLLAIESCKSYHILLSSPVTEGLWFMLESSSK